MRSAFVLVWMLSFTLGACVLVVDPDDDGRYTESLTATVDAGGARHVEIDAEAGELIVEGVPGLDEVRVRGTARASSERRLDDIRLRAYRSGDVVQLVADVPGGFGYAALDLVVEVPAALTLRVDDDSGDIEIAGTASVDLTDGSGDVLIQDVYGDVLLEDGSGEIEIDGVRGDVLIFEDGSGSIYVTDVAGDVRIEEDGSGDIDVADVDGDFIVDRDGSGRIRYHNIGGRVRVP